MQNISMPSFYSVPTIKFRSHAGAIILAQLGGYEQLDIPEHPFGTAVDAMNYANE